MTVCREGSGCAEQPRDLTTFDPSEAVPDRDPDGRIAALEELAATDPSAAYDLALRLFRGDGFPRDSYKALQWMRRAAERGDVRAQLALGRVYMGGLEEMGPDLKEADTWLSLAAAAGDPEAKELQAEVQDALADETYYQDRYGYWRDAAYAGWYRGWRYGWIWSPRWHRWYYR
ncbi:tetratricopeptide repeat protein [Geminicoccus roseus]|uniref:tetratricopeptide repeat protein n=1 Tax=Geminicoccus roseus TaxID=404900 RepID=UPI0004256917|nr:tetratricopeptide repeat protein [Geminicoccus roseus]